MKSEKEGNIWKALYNLLEIFKEIDEEELKWEDNSKYTVIDGKMIKL